MDGVQIVKDIQKVRSTLEKELAGVIATRLAQFERETGLTPSAVNVRMVEATSIGEPLPRHIVADVRVDLSI